MQNWITIKTQEDIDDFLNKACHFHDAVYSAFNYFPVMNDFRGQHLIMNFNVFTVDENDNLLQTGLEMEFSGLERLNFLPADYYLISNAAIKPVGDSLVWGIIPGPACKLNEYGFSDELTFVKCKNIKWRFCNAFENC